MKKPDDDRAVTKYDMAYLRKYDQYLQNHFNDEGSCGKDYKPSRKRNCVRRINASVQCKAEEKEKHNQY